MWIIYNWSFYNIFQESETNNLGQFAIWLLRAVWAKLTEVVRKICISFVYKSKVFWFTKNVEVMYCFFCYSKLSKHHVCHKMVSYSICRIIFLSICINGNPSCSGELLKATLERINNINILSFLNTNDELFISFLSKSLDIFLQEYDIFWKVSIICIKNKRHQLS